MHLHCVEAPHRTAARTSVAQRPSSSSARNAERREPWRRYYWRNCAFAVSCAFPTESTCAEGEKQSKSSKKKKWYVRTQLSVTVVARWTRNRMPNIWWQPNLRPGGRYRFMQYVASFRYTSLSEIKLLNPAFFL